MPRNAEWVLLPGAKSSTSNAVAAPEDTEQDEPCSKSQDEAGWEAEEQAGSEARCSRLHASDACFRSRWRWSGARRTVLAEHVTSHEQLEVRRWYRRGWWLDNHLSGPLSYGQERGSPQHCHASKAEPKSGSRGSNRNRTVADGAIVRKGNLCQPF